MYAKFTFVGDSVESALQQVGEMQFSGTHPYAVDAKGRVAIPARFREQIVRAGEQELFLAPALRDPCLKLFPGAAWRALRAQLERIPNPQQRQSAKRAILSRAHEVATDTQGRVLLPAVLREHASIGSEVVVVGEGDHIQFWAPARWEAALQSAIDDVSGAETMLAELGF